MVEIKLERKDKMIREKTNKWAMIEIKNIKIEIQKENKCENVEFCSLSRAHKPNTLRYLFKKNIKFMQNCMNFTVQMIVLRTSKILGRDYLGIAKQHFQK